MRNSIKISLMTLMVSMLYDSVHSMQVNFGYTVSSECNINTYLYRNDGTLRGINNVNMCLSSLSGSGTIAATNNAVDIQTDSFSYSGTITAGKECTIKAKALEGSCTIQAPYITIICDKFKLEGMLSCDKECIIYAKEAFDTNMFKRVGNGQFKIVVSPYEIKKFSFKNLCSTSYDDFCSKCLEYQENDIDNKIKEIRTYAALNFLDDKSILENIKEKLASQANFHQERLHELRDKDALNNGLIKCGITTLGLFASYIVLRNKESLMNKYELDAKIVAAITAGLSSLPAFFSISDFYNWRNPRHSEKYEKLSLILSRIDHALTFERTVEEQIINL